MDFFKKICKWMFSGGGGGSSSDEQQAETLKNTYNFDSHPLSAPSKSYNDLSWELRRELTRELKNPSFNASTSQPRHSFKPTLSLDPSCSDNPQGRRKYVLVRDNVSPTYKIPKDIKDLFKKGIVPQVLKMPVSQSIYKDYFATLLYAEDFYIEKWTDFLLEDVTLKLEDAEVYDRQHKHRNRNEEGKGGGKKKTFVKFEIDSIPEERPFILSRDFVSARPLGSNIKLFEVRTVLNRKYS